MILDYEAIAREELEDRYARAEANEKMRNIGLKNRATKPLIRRTTYINLTPFTPEDTLIGENVEHAGGVLSCALAACGHCPDFNRDDYKRIAYKVARDEAHRLGLRVIELATDPRRILEN